MIAKILLTVLSFGVCLYAWSQYRRSPFVGLVAIVTALTGSYFVWFPAQATRIAELIGIGRGVDLVLYIWVGISFILLLNIHLKMRAQMELITELARELTFTRAAGADAGREAGQGGQSDGSPPIRALQSLTRPQL